MALVDSSGNVLSSGALDALHDDVSGEDLVTFNTPVYETFREQGVQGFNTGTRVKFHAGQTVKLSTVNEYYNSMTCTAATPNTGPKAGGTAVTLTGTNLSNVKDVGFGGMNATNVVVVSATSVTCTTPPSATTGAKDVILSDGKGQLVKTGFYTYT